MRSNSHAAAHADPCRTARAGQQAHFGVSAKRRVRTWPAGEDDGLARSKIARAQRPQGVECRSHFPLLGSLGRARKCLRTTQMVYAMIERGLLPGVTRIGRRLLVRSTDLLDFLDHKRTPSPQEYRR